MQVNTTRGRAAAQDGRGQMGSTRPRGQRKSYDAERELMRRRVEMFEEGNTPADIAEAQGVTIQSVCRSLQRHYGVPTRLARFRMQEAA